MEDPGARVLRRGRQQHKGRADAGGAGGDLRDDYQERALLGRPALHQHGAPRYILYYYYIYIIIIFIYYVLYYLLYLVYHILYMIYIYIYICL